jgi:hypothetical protein
MQRSYSDTFLSFDWENLTSGQRPPAELRDTAVIDLDKIEYIISGVILPVMSNVTTLRSLFDAAISNDPAFSWLYTNGAASASIVAYLGLRVGVTCGQISKELNKHRSNIELSIRERPYQHFVDQMTQAAKSSVFRDTIHN